jgi:hypothetical protein
VGNAFGLTINGSLVRGCDLLRTKQRRNVEVEGGGIGGGFISSLCRLDSIGVGPFSWPDPVAALALTRSGILGSKDIGGLIGNSTLERFHCTFDYADRKLYLEPGKRHATRERTSRFGALLVRVGPDVYAGGVLLGSAAQAAGLRWYDKILAIDDRPLERWTREEVDRLLDNGEIGAVHTVTYQRLDEPQRTVEVRLKDVL